MTTASNLKLYATHPHPCSYLDDKQATTVFIDPDIAVDVSLYSELADLGFRRSGPHIYRPHCQACKACIAVRIPVHQFKASRTQRKIINRNKSLQVEEIDAIHNDECYDLYHRYISLRHSDGDMFPPTREQYESFLTKEMNSTHFFGFRDDSNLLAVAVTDQMDNGLSAIYTFYEPTMEKRSFGSFGILWQIEKAKSLGLDYLYLGYWIRDCQKMSYKTNFRPLQMLINQQWINIT